MKSHLLPTLLFLCLAAACDPGHGATDDDATADASAALEVADDAAPAADVPAADVWPDGFWLPDNINQLYGHWENDDGETIRVFEIAQFDPYDADMLNVSPVYWLYRYPKGTKATVAERGRATLAMGPLLHTEVVWSEVVTDKGKNTDLTLLAAPAGSFSLATGAGTPRVYLKKW